MSKPWKQIKIFTADAEQSVIIEPNPERTGVCIHSNEELEVNSFCLYATYDEAIAIAQGILDFVEMEKKELNK